MDTIKSKYHETLAATVIKNLEKRQMEGYYCPTVEDAEKLALSLIQKKCITTLFPATYIL